MRLIMSNAPINGNGSHADAATAADAGGRAADGKFAAGNKFARGNPFGRLGGDAAGGARCQGFQGRS
jgi:hypothetical protein